MCLLLLQACPSDAKLWCALGDITQQDEHYVEAWEVSNHRSSRAQRSLGRYAHAPVLLCCCGSACKLYFLWSIDGKCTRHVMVLCVCALRDIDCCAVGSCQAVHLCIQLGA